MFADVWKSKMQKCKFWMHLRNAIAASEYHKKEIFMIRKVKNDMSAVILGKKKFKINH